MPGIAFTWVTNWPALARLIVVATEFDAELVRPMGLAFADAFYLRRVQGIGLRPALTLLLADAPRQRQQLCKCRFEPAVALDRAADVADHVEIGPQRLELPVGAFELLGVGIVLMLDQGELAHPRIGLA